MSRSAAKDLTKGSPMKLILGFMLPLLLGMLFQQFYNMVDTMIVGKYLGPLALAGVGSTGSINFCVLGFVSGLCAGFAIPVAQKFGAENYAELKKYVGATVWVSVGFAVVLTAATSLLCGNILTWMKTPSDAFSEAYNYIFVIFLGIPVTILYNILSGRFLDDFERVEHLLGYIYDCGSENGCSGCGFGDGCFAACIGDTVPCPHCAQMRDFTHWKSRAEICSVLYEKTMRGGLADGLAVFHYGDRLDFSADGGQRLGLAVYGGCHGGEQGWAVYVLSV